MARSNLPGTRSGVLKDRGNIGPALGVLGHVRMQDGDDCDVAASIRHQFQLGAARIDTLLITPIATSPTPRFRLYTGEYDNLTLLWDSNDAYPGQTLTEDVAFAYRVGVTVALGDLMVMTVIDDGVTAMSVFAWALIGEHQR